MRKCSIKIAKAFIKHESARTKNTSTDGTTVYLHGNAIAWHEDSIAFTLCGWNTVTTRERLNAIFDASNVPLRVCQRNYDPYIRNYKTDQEEEISSNLPYHISDFAV